MLAISWSRLFRWSAAGIHEKLVVYRCGEFHSYVSLITVPRFPARVTTGLCRGVTVTIDSVLPPGNESAQDTVDKVDPSFLTSGKIGKLPLTVVITWRIQGRVFS